MKKSLFAIFLIVICTTTLISINGCFVSKNSASKSGAQLWAENCNRCHNAPPPGEFNNANWDVVGTHMQVRANISKTDMAKIGDFLKSANN